VFEACGAAISELNAIVKIIVNGLSGVNVFITADHGFLYTYKPLEESQKISCQTFNSEIYELGRRYSLVPPETFADYLLPMRRTGSVLVFVLFLLHTGVKFRCK